MTRWMRITAAAVLLAATSADAQVVVYDPAVTSRQSAIATIKSLSLTVATRTNALMTEMSKRLAQLHAMEHYAVTKVANWTLGRLEVPTSVLGDARAFFKALNAGEELVDAVSRPPLEGRWTVSGAFQSALGTLDAADGVLTTGAALSGRIRAYGRAENAQIDRLETDVTAGAGSTTAVLDTVSGAAVIGARQQEARVQLALSLVEQGVVENLRARQTEAAGMRLRLGALQHRETTDTEGAAWAEDLAAWKQP